MRASASNGDKRCRLQGLRGSCGRAFAVRCPIRPWWRSAWVDLSSVYARGLSTFGIGLVRQLHSHSEGVGQSLTRLATGKRINSAADGPADVVAIDKLSFEIETLEKQIQGLERERIWLSARDGAYAGLSDLLAGLSGTVVAAANTGALSDEEREAFSTEAGGAVDAIQRLMQTSQFQGDRLFTGDISGLASVSVTRLDEDGNEIQERKTLLDLSELLAGDRDDLEAAQTLVERATESVNGRRASFGARITFGIEPEIRVKQRQLEEHTGARSLIEDADYAEEVAGLVRNQILEQAALSTIQIAQQSAESVLQLLEPLSAR
ncbi:MAG: flagellin [Planctomycetota bacterium]